MSGVGSAPGAAAGAAGGVTGGVVLRGVHVGDGVALDVRCAGGVIASVGPSGQGAQSGDTVLDLAGFLVLPAFGEPHAHLDKALTAERVPNPSGDLDGAIEAWIAYRPKLTFDDIVERAEQAARLLLSNGCTAIRTHVDVAANIGMKGVDALVEVRRRLEGLVDLQIVALQAAWDDHGLLREAIARGADIVGGSSHIADDSLAEQLTLLEMAGEMDRPVDLHTDENLRPDSADLRAMADWVQRTGFERAVAASHCCSLGIQDPDTQAATAHEVAAAGISIVTLPQTNLFLQGRAHPVGTPRGLTAVHQLARAGVTVCAGGDNIQDPFNLVGRGDPLEAASLLVTAGHVLPDDAVHAVSGAVRAVLGLPPVTIAPGSPADLVALPARSRREAVAFAPSRRVVLRAGRIVSDGTAR